jgi:transglutaminase-like putative cysteine protease
MDLEREELGRNGNDGPGEAENQRPGEARGESLDETGRKRLSEAEKQALDAYLKPGRFINSDHPDVVEFAEEALTGLGAAGKPMGDREKAVAGAEPGTPAADLDHRQKAVALFHAVRDRFRYDPYRIDLNPEQMTASAVLDRGYGFCITKSVLLAAVARIHGIPARLGFADVRNHLTTERLRRSMGTDVFVWHGFAELLIDGRWVKATPAFNRSLCERFGVPTLDFDGIYDSLFQPFDGEGNQYMEYIQDHGNFSDLPLDELRLAFETAYPQLVSDGRCDLSGRFEEDAVAGRE